MKKGFKTLKDIENIEKDCEWVYSQDLKAEAIKWVKKLEKDIDKTGKFHRKSKVKWIKQFFNLNEGNLK